jgi:four helix bundle protein
MKFNLEQRLIDFAVLTLEISERMPDTRGSNHLSGQLVRSGTAPALQYGEAQSAESRKDFIHKMKVALKELRESSICLQIILRKKYLSGLVLDSTIKESSELIAILSRAFKRPIKI